MKPTPTPDQAQVRSAIERGRCPECGRGPFRVLSGHTSRVHGIDKYELRNMAGLTTSDPISSEEVRAAAAERARLRGFSPAGKPFNRKGPGARRWTAAGIAHSANVSAEYWASASPADHARHAERVRAGVTDRTRALLAEHQRGRIDKQRDAAILSALAAGRTHRNVAQEFGVSRGTISNIVNRNRGQALANVDREGTSA